MRVQILMIRLPIQLKKKKKDASSSSASGSEGKDGKEIVPGRELIKAEVEEVRGRAAGAAV